jgi:hypothetical protein
MKNAVKILEVVFVVLAVIAFLYAGSGFLFYRYHTATKVSSDGTTFAYLSISNTGIKRALMATYTPLMRVVLAKPPLMEWHQP